MLGLTLKSKYIVLKRELKEAELAVQYWKYMHDIEFNKRLNTIKELAKKERRIEELEKTIGGPKMNYKNTDLNNQYPKMIELPQEVKLKILIDDLNIECHNLLNERLNPNNTRVERVRLVEKYKEADRKRQLVLFELDKLKEDE